MLKLFLLLLLCGLTTTLKAATGCVISGQNVAYTTYTGTTAGYRVYSRSTSVTADVNAFCYYDTGVSCAVTSPTNCASCTLYMGNYYQLGTEYYYSSSVSCPIDDYVPHLSIVMIGVSFFYLRKKAYLQVIN